MVHKKIDLSWKRNENRLGVTFYGSIGLTLLLHYFFVSGWNFGSTAQMAISFLMFNFIFGIANIVLNVNFKSKVK